MKFAAVVRCLALAIASLPRVVAAHEQPFSFVDLRVDRGALSGSVTAHVVDLAHEAGLPDARALLDSSTVERHRPVLERMLAKHLELRADGVRVEPRWGVLRIVPEKQSVAFAWTSSVRDPAVLELNGPLFPYDPPHETYVNGYVDGALVHQDLLDRERTHGSYPTGARPKPWNVVRLFVAEGIHHIFIGPDHILFVIGLLLLGGSLLRLLKIVTAFTIAHTITLVLATLRIVDPPAKVIEPLIALSIVYIGVETLRALSGGRDVRARIAFGFGLIHGFGFASVLREFGLPGGALGWALGSFNLGVEIGQACIVLAVAPLLGWARSRTPEGGRRLVTAMSALIIAAGAYWFVERLLA
jgi:hydrogenase/urease accessory protein HupE